VTVCPVCGTTYKDDSKEESTVPCPKCEKEIHHLIKVEFTIDCGPNGLTQADGIKMLDGIVRLVCGRGFELKDIEFLEKSRWKELQVCDVRKLQLEGIFKT